MSPKRWTQAALDPEFRTFAQCGCSTDGVFFCTPHAALLMHDQCTREGVPTHNDHGRRLTLGERLTFQHEEVPDGNR